MQSPPSARNASKNCVAFGSIVPKAGAVQHVDVNDENFRVSRRHARQAFGAAEVQDVLLDLGEGAG